MLYGLKDGPKSKLREQENTICLKKKNTSTRKSAIRYSILYLERRKIIDLTHKQKGAQYGKKYTYCNKRRSLGSNRKARLPLFRLTELKSLQGNLPSLLQRKINPKLLFTVGTERFVIKIVMVTISARRVTVNIQEGNNEYA